MTERARGPFLKSWSWSWGRPHGTSPINSARPKPRAQAIKSNSRPSPNFAVCKTGPRRRGQRSTLHAQRRSRQAGAGFEHGGGGPQIKALGDRYVKSKQGVDKLSAGQQRLTERTTLRPHSVTAGAWIEARSRRQAAVELTRKVAPSAGGRAG